MAVNTSGSFSLDNAGFSLNRFRVNQFKHPLSVFLTVSFTFRLSFYSLDTSSILVIFYVNEFKIGQ